MVRLLSPPPALRPVRNPFPAWLLLILFSWFSANFINLLQLLMVTNLSGRWKLQGGWGEGEKFAAIIVTGRRYWIMRKKDSGWIRRECAHERKQRDIVADSQGLLLLPEYRRKSGENWTRKWQFMKNCAFQSGMGIYGIDREDHR